MNDPEFKWKPNPHFWRKMKQAETNMLRGFRRKRHGWRVARYWARLMDKWIEKVMR